METKFRSAAMKSGLVRASNGWIVSPAFDLLLLANLWWLVAALPIWVDAFGHVRLEFWQVYFLTTPHRWLTLLLVVLDADRRAGRQRLLLSLALLAPVVVGSVWLTTAQLTCLALIDYVWNAWHFGSQHGGILRIYSRRSKLPSPRWENWALRIFVPYVSLRLAGWSTGWTEGRPWAESATLLLDVAFVSVPLLLLAGELWRGGQARRAKVVYLASVVLMYSALLLALSLRATGWIASLTVASAAFHATEYLAIVTHYARGRATQAAASVFRSVARRWVEVLVVYIVLLGAVALWADQAWREWWLAINLCVAYLHYAYDGLIWKLRQPATARALGC